jgi:hypothetical protein
MTLPVDETLRRLSHTLRSEIGPAVGDEYTRTQAFMASVILERLSKQVELAPAHEAAEASDLTALRDSLAPLLHEAPQVVTDALRAAAATGAVAGLGGLIGALYEWGIDRPEASEALALIRPVLRRDIDRRMEIAR